VDARVLRAASALTERGAPYALATVTWRRAPSSGRTGSSAIIEPDGRVTGWLGGACAQPTVVAAAQEAMRTGQPRLLVLGEPDARDEVEEVPMACASEGALEVFVEPMLPAPLLVVVGRSPLVAALVGLADTMDWRTAVVDPGGSTADHPQAGAVVVDELDLSSLPVDERTSVVVATQGHFDEPAMRAALATPAGYVGLVASAKRAGTVLEWLREEGVDDLTLARVHAPAGLDLGPVDHREIAVAVLAELVALRRSVVAGTVPVAEPERAIDPVCGMTVEVADAHFHTVHDGTDYYFCAAGCQRAFEADPDSFLTPA
jgi:xanthine dehydrogenase accessory factor